MQNLPQERPLRSAAIQRFDGLNEIVAATLNGGDRRLAVA